MILLPGINHLVPMSSLWYRVATLLMGGRSYYGPRTVRMLMFEIARGLCTGYQGLDSSDVQTF